MLLLAFDDLLLFITLFMLVGLELQHIIESVSAPEKCVSSAPCSLAQCNSGMTSLLSNKLSLQMRK